ncbi:MAG: hypothetical protein JXP73_17775 [Deltaproteobacteria bacterium]|nr:hypothetical protein [Deltaproteobacteria bacterium]
MRRNILIISLFVAVASLAASSAWAQQPQTATASGAVSAHGSGLGIGAATMLNGTSGLLGTWGNARGSFHVDGLFGMRRYNPNGNYTTSFSVGGRFWYHLHAASFADFSLGGGLGFVRWETNPGFDGNDDRIDVCLQGGAQIRAFMVPNVAFIADLGLGVYFGAEDDILIGGESVGGYDAGGANFVSGTLGIAYFFE